MQERVKVFTFVSGHGETVVEPPHEEHINQWLSTVKGRVVHVSQSESARGRAGRHVTIWYVPDEGTIPHPQVEAAGRQGRAKDMTLRLHDSIPWGRSFEEYQRMSPTWLSSWPRRRPKCIKDGFQAGKRSSSYPVSTSAPGGAKDPAGRSSLAAYQTCRAGVSFGRTALRRPDTGRPPGLCTLARFAGVILRILARQGTRRTETVVVVPVRRHIVVTVGRTHVRRLIVERAATQHTATRSSPSGSRLYRRDSSAADRCSLAGRGRSNS
jgi:hypothetical protein